MIDHVNAYVLSVRDLDKCIAFYGEKLGFKMKDKTDDFAYMVFGSSGPGLGLVSIECAAKMISHETYIRSKDAGLDPIGIISQSLLKMWTRSMRI